MQAVNEISNYMTFLYLNVTIFKNRIHTVVIAL